MKVLLPITYLEKIRYQNGATTSAPSKQYSPSFHAFSRSLVLAYTLVIKKMM